MKTVAALLFTLVATLPLSSEELSKLHPNLEPLRPFLGKTWRGDLAQPGADRVNVDVARWERILNGQAIRILHSVDDGNYGGETIIRWDETRKAITYYYFTTAGFMTSGTMTVEKGKYTSFEKVSPPAEGVTEVKGTGEVKDDGTMVTTSEYLKNGRWIPGHGATYREAPDAKVIFK